jgi:hypothetical protein
MRKENMRITALLLARDSLDHEDALRTVVTADTCATALRF